MSEALFEAAKRNDIAAIAAALDRDPAALNVRDQPYAWTLLHHAAQHGHLGVVNLLLDRGCDVNTLEIGDHTTALHWAAAAGHVDVVRRLLDAGVDPIGHGDDHELEAIGWASCWDGTNTDQHRAIVDLLRERGARHHIFSAIAMNLSDEVRRIVSEDPGALARKMSQFEDFRLPLHFAVHMNRFGMVALLIELGADPRGRDGSGYTAPAYAMAAGADRALHEALRDRGEVDLFSALALGDYPSASAIVSSDPAAVEKDGVLPLMAKRGDTAAVQWLLARGADPNTRWAHWDSNLTALHLAVFGNHPDTVHALIEFGADPRIKDSKHDSDAIGWAEFFARPDLVALLQSRQAPGH
jgi:ankyrin repeat protein